MSDSERSRFHRTGELPDVGAEVSETARRFGVSPATTVGTRVIIKELADAAADLAAALAALSRSLEDTATAVEQTRAAVEREGDG